jgi:hypothetical protein
LRTIEFEGSRVERRRSAVAEIRDHLTKLYRGFAGWASLYGWISEGNCKKIENYLSKADELCSEFSAEIEARGYHRVRRSMEKRVSKKLRPLKTEAESGLEAELTEPRPGWRDRFLARSG